jgi:hypothetical protein
MAVTRQEDLTRDDLTSLDDSRLQEIACARIYDAALMNGTRWASRFHDLCDEIYDECKRRSRGIYQRAWNEAASGSCRPNPIDPTGA